MRACESLPALMDTLSSISELSLATGLQPEVAVESATDHALLEAIKTGDHNAFAELVSRYRHVITNYIYRMTGDYDGSVDLAQETFIRVYRAADRYQPNHTFATYIYRIASNLAISELRTRKRNNLVSLTGFFEFLTGGDALDMNPPDQRPLQDVALIDKERRLEVQRAISTLPDKYRAPLILRDIEGRTYDEISQILSMGEGSVKSRIFRARGMLRERLTAYFEKESGC